MKKKKHFPDLEKPWNLKKGQNDGKIMEFQSTHMEKSWGKNFHAPRIPSNNNTLFTQLD